MLEIRGLNAAYGRAHVLFNLEIEVATGEVAVLLGRNGAGKSTTLKAIMGLVPALSGQVLMRQTALHRLKPYQIARLGLGYVPEDRRIFTDLTVRQNLEVGRRPPRPGAPHWTPEKLCELFPPLAAMLERLGARMSGGEQQMLAIARTLMGNPQTILLDEPSEGLAPLIVSQVANTIRQLKREGLTVLLAEQNLGFAQTVADRAYVLERGEVRYRGTMAELLQSGAVRQQTLQV